VSKNIIICGHGGKDPGAGANGINERDFIRKELAPRIKKYGGGDIEIFDMSKNCYQETQKGRGIQTLKGKNVIEFHLDAADPTAKGGHIIIAKGLSADAMDQRLADVLKKHSGWRNGEAFDLRDNLLNLNTAKRLGINYRLVEVCYITNPNEVAYLKKNVDQIAKDFAEAITGKVQAATTPGTYRIYTGTFDTDAKAEAAAIKIAELGFKAFFKDKRAWTGTFSTREAAEKARVTITAEYGYNPKIRKESA
jgi:N-acetylmuramoyl-L-alanine amidase